MSATIEEEIDLKVVNRNVEKHRSPVVVENWKTRTFVILLFLVTSFLMFNFNIKAEKTLDYYIGTFASISLVYMLMKLALSFFYKPATENPKYNYKVSVVIPSYNEDSDSVVDSIKCLLNQDYLPHEIIFIDDGSEDSSAYQEVKRMAAILNNKIDTKIIFHRFDKNYGKKQAQAWGFKKSSGDIIMLADSDGYIFPNAIRELLKPFNDPKVTSTVGHISARNLKENFLTRLQDIMYYNAFRVSRASQSITNSVLVCSGALSMHRREVVINNLDDFLKVKFLGISSDNGDDRRLTYLSLRSGGKTKYQSTAICVTDVPIKTKNFFKQQVRWSKSFFIQTAISLGYAWKRPLMLFWLLGESLLWFIFSITQITTFFNWNGNFYSSILLFISIYFIMSAFVGGIYYALKNPILYLFSPIFSLAHMFILFPVRIYALLTLPKSGWGTR